MLRNSIVTNIMQINEMSAHLRGMSVRFGEFIHFDDVKNRISVVIDRVRSER